MSDVLAMDVSALSKCYHVYERPQDRLKQMIFGGKAKFYREFWALHDVNFSVSRGESIGILGRNGAGKSTLLQLISGVSQPTSGTVKVNGRVAPLLQLGTSFNPEFTGLENIDLSATILGLSTEEIEDRREAIVDFAEIGQFIDQPVRTYSSGMYARLAFAVAAHVNADILIVDEVLSVGDIGFTQKCSRFLREFRERGTLLFVSHDIGAVLNMCDRAIWLDQGHIVEDDIPKRVVPHYSTWMSNQEKLPAVEFLRRIRERDDTETEAESFVNREMTSDSSGRIPATALVRADLPEITETQLQIPQVSFSGFDWNARSAGAMEGRIVDAWWENTRGDRVTLVQGGDLVTLNISCEAVNDLQNAVVGFGVKDRLGQILLAWDTSREVHLAGTTILAGESTFVQFSFVFPYLKGGDYTVNFALASGALGGLHQQHWLYDAMRFHVPDSSRVQGIIGVPIQVSQIKAVAAAT
ncbi:MAG: ABC transporter ATP-binding protein [Beijerinckiaceae bacterium]